MKFKNIGHTLTKIDKKTAREKQLFNIKCFSGLSRKGLQFNKIERRILLYTTSKREKVYIQYPGKETKNSNPEKIRPWDFRPQLFKGNEKLKDQSFKDVWNEIESLKNVGDDYLSILATLFLRYSILLDFKLVDEQCPYEDINMQTNKIIKRGKIRIKWWKLILDADWLDYLSKKIGKINNKFSLEGYLYYNDLLCQNEDCKYFYRAKQQSKQWDGQVGRNNTYRTHMSVIAYLKGHLKFSEIMDMFQRGMGVAKLQDKYIEQVTDGRIKKETKHA